MLPFRRRCLSVLAVLGLALVGVLAVYHFARPRAEAQTPDAFCAAAVSLPRVKQQNKWQLSEAWQSTCREKGGFDLESQRTLERNPCWRGLKATCHANLKAHLSWADMQRLASMDGAVPAPEQSSFHPLKDPELCDRPESGQGRKWTANDTMLAQQWFRKNVAVFVLNLPSDKERWSMISARLQDLRIRPIRVPGLDMRDEGALEDAQRSGVVPQGYNFTRAQAIALTQENEMGGILGTLGCAGAHFRAQARALADGRPLAVVFEDDVWPADDFVRRLWSLVTEELPCDWEVASLYSRCPFGQCISPLLARVRPDINEPAWRCHQGVNWGMQGMLYRISRLPDVQAVWKSAVFDENRPHCLDVDVALASVSDRVGFYAVPSGKESGFLQETNQQSTRWTINVDNGDSGATAEPRPIQIGMPFPD